MVLSGAWESFWRYIVAAAACVLLGILSFGGDASVPLLRYADLGIHETGHLVTFWMPEVQTAMAGSAAQVAVPLLLAGYFLLSRREVHAAAVCLAWAGTSMNNVSVYIADAPTEALPLVGGGTHDWAFILGPEHFDAIDRSAAIAGAVHDVGLGMVVVAVVACLAVPVWAWRGGGTPLARGAGSTRPGS